MDGDAAVSLQKTEGGKRVEMLSLTRLLSPLSAGYSLTEPDSLLPGLTRDVRSTLALATSRSATELVS